MRAFQYLMVFGWIFVLLGTLPSKAADDLTLKRVLLSTGGVGYFEYEADVDGDADLSLRVGLNQVDDVLKSVVVYDDKGQVGSISLPGKTPLREVFREMPFDQNALDSPVALLSTLRGAEVEVKGSRNLKGRIISVKPETVSLPDNKGAVTQHRVSLLTAAGIRQLVLEETDLLEFSDPKLQDDINRALKALADLGQRDRRTLKVTVKGDGPRNVRVAYLIEAPLWKTSYRLTMPDDPLATSAGMQGWAVVENLSGEDWKDVELTIVSGNPVTFKQALYDTYYVERTSVPVEVLGRLLPPVDSGAVPAQPRISSLNNSGASRAKKARSRRQNAVAGVMALASPVAREALPESDAAAPDVAKIIASESSEATSYVLFRHPQPISVANGFSLSIPIVGRAFEAERLALYQPRTHTQHPLAAIRLTNDGETALPPGILTLYERGADGRVAYVGDARMKTVPAGDKRMLSYALDQNIRIDRESKSDNRIATGKIAGGLLVLTQKRRTETIYRITAPTNSARKLVIEHARAPGWDLVEPASDNVELTDGFYRIPKTLEAGKSVAFTVALERTENQRISLANMRPEQIRFYASAKELQPEQRRAIAALSQKLKAIEDANAVVNRLEQDQQALFNDQNRLTGTLQAVPKDSDLFQRYLKNMTANEDSIEATQLALEDARSAADAAQKDMIDYVRSLKL